MQSRRIDPTYLLKVMKRQEAISGDLSVPKFSVRRRPTKTFRNSSVTPLAVFSFSRRLADLCKCK